MMAQGINNTEKINCLQNNHINTDAGFGAYFFQFGHVAREGYVSRSFLFIITIFIYYPFFTPCRGVLLKKRPFIMGRTRRMQRAANFDVQKTHPSNLAVSVLRTGHLINYYI